jgi:pyrrolidone-carboxylate peptidase
MKLIIYIFLTLTFSVNSYAMKVLVTYFDPFGRSPKNNSQVIAKLVQKKFSMLDTQVELSTCQLRTVYDKAFYLLEDCIAAMDIKPDIVISLGEASCQKVRLETRARNTDSGSITDNDGILRKKHLIYPDAPKYIGSTLPLEKAYCKMEASERKNISLSKSAGSFVCNNTMYHSLFNLDIPYTFIHVPSTPCTSNRKNETTSTTLAHFINKLSLEDISSTGPQPTSKELVKKRIEDSSNNCEAAFYKKLKRAY